MLINRNNLSKADLLKLKPLVRQFVAESNFSVHLDPEAVCSSTLGNIVLGLERKAEHDTWILGDFEGYCLCRVDKDADGKLAYVAYQLWLSPKLRDGIIVRDFVFFLEQYAFEQGYERMYVVSSRLDKVKAYARGLGRRFQAKSVIFGTELRSVK